MENILLAVITLSGFYISSTCAEHLPYFNSQVSPANVVDKHSYWRTHGTQSSAYHQKEKFSKWHQIPSKQAGPFPWWNKMASPQYNAHKPSSSSVIQTTKYPPPMQHPIREGKVDDSSDLSTLVHQLQQKLHQIEQQLAETPKPTEPQQAPTDITVTPKSDPKPIEETDNDPFWIQLDVVNKQLDPERLIKTINILLENLKVSIKPSAGDVSEENVYDLIDIRGNFP